MLVVDDCNIQELSRKYLSILNILRTSHVALMYLGSQSEETLLHILNSHSSMGLLSRW
jgi:hypothetical protein